MFNNNDLSCNLILLFEFMVMFPVLFLSIFFNVSYYKLVVKYLDLLCFAFELSCSIYSPFFNTERNILFLFSDNLSVSILHNLKEKKQLFGQYSTFF